MVQKLGVVRLYYAFGVLGATVRHLDSASVEELAEGVGFWEVLVDEGKELFPDVGFHCQVVWGAEPRYLPGLPSPWFKCIGLLVSEGVFVSTFCQSLLVGIFGLVKLFFGAGDGTESLVDGYRHLLYYVGRVVGHGVEVPCLVIGFPVWAVSAGLQVQGDVEEVDIVIVDGMT